MCKGNTYKQGNAVIISQSAYQIDVKIGRITLILCHDFEKIHFLVEVLHTEFEPTMRLYKLGGTHCHQLLKIEELLVYAPHHIYQKDTTSYVKLKHGLVSSRLC